MYLIVLIYAGFKCIYDLRYLIKDQVRYRLKKKWIGDLGEEAALIHHHRHQDHQSTISFYYIIMSLR